MDEREKERRYLEAAIEATAYINAGQTGQINRTSEQPSVRYEWLLYLCHLDNPDNAQIEALFGFYRQNIQTDAHLSHTVRECVKTAQRGCFKWLLETIKKKYEK
jgi:hypothetical protein